MDELEREPVGEDVGPDEPLDGIDRVVLLEPGEDGGGAEGGTGAQDRDRLRDRARGLGELGQAKQDRTANRVRVDAANPSDVVRARLHPLAGELEEQRVDQERVPARELMGGFDELALGESPSERAVSRRLPS